MKKVIALAVTILVILSSLWLVRSRREARRGREQRDAEYRDRLERFQHDLSLGTPRSGVRRYLDAQKMPYGEANWNFDVKIGDEPGDGWACDRWSVYVEIRFSHIKGQAEPSPFDNLDDIAIQKIGHCL